MDDIEEARLRANAEMEVLRSQPIYTDVLRTADADAMAFEIWIDISPNDDNEILRVSSINIKVISKTYIEHSTSTTIPNGPLYRRTIL